jgi:aminoglycoside 2''-phosphotransferase
VAEQLAAFLRELHGLAEDGMACDFPRLQEAAFAARLRRAADAELGDRLPRHVRTRLDSLLESRAVDLREHPLALLHCDLAPGHLLYDQRRAKLTGVIDFGDAALGPPARDFIFLYEDFGVKCCEAVAAAYAGHAAAALMERVRTWYLLEALAWTLGRLRLGRSVDVAHGLGEITREVTLRA